jgi:hypothetical protein
MPANEYYFVSHWRLHCTPQEAFDILKDSAALPKWWPAGFLSAEPHTFEDGAEGVSVATKGWLPYILRFNMRELASDPPGSLVIEASGDLNGRGIWTLMPDGDYTNITYDWRISAEKPLIKMLSPLLKPLFKSSHDWIMKKGEQSLRLELERRRAVSEAVRDTVAPPPGPMSLPILPIAGGAVLVGLWLLRPRKKKPSTPKEHLVTLAAVTAATIKAQRKDAKKTARKAEKELRRRGSRAYSRLEDAIERAQEPVGVARGRAQALLDRTEIDERVVAGVGAARERLEDALERANVPERVEAVRERVERAIDKSDVPERIKGARKAARKRSKGLFSRWHL